MGSLGPKKISSNYQKLLQISESGVIADGAGNPVTLNLSGSSYYISGSDNVNVLQAITVTGSIIPEGSGSWDLGSEDNPFRDLYVTEESIKMVVNEYTRGDPRRVVDLKASDVTGWLKGEFKKKIGDDGKRLAIPITTTIQTIITEPFEFNRFRNLYPIDLASNDTVQDTYWANDGDNLYLKPTRFRTIGMDIDDLEIV